MNATTETPEFDDEIDVGAVVSTIWAHRWWPIAGGLLLGAIFLISAYFMTPIYRSATVLSPVDTDASGLGSLNSTLGQFSGLAALAGINLGGGSSTLEESLAVLRSREFTENFIRKHNLMPELFYRKWDAAANRWRNPDKAPTMAEAAKMFSKKVRSVSHDKKTGLVTVQVDWRDPDMAASWANMLVEQLNTEMRSRAIAQTQASVEYLQKELENTYTVDTRAAISRLMEAQINQRMFANVTKEYSFRVVDRALPSDPRDEVRPNKPVMLVAGGLLGFLAGAVLALIRARSRALRSRA